MLLGRDRRLVESFGAAGRRYTGTEGGNAELLATCGTVAEFLESDLSLSTRLTFLC